MKLDNTISAVVTGGASGLGLATARALTQQGVKVALFDMNPEAGEQAARALGAVFCKVDVTSDRDVDAAFAKARAANGQERILVNCAGIGSSAKTAGRDRETGAITHYPLAQFERIIQVNLIGTYRCIAKSAAGMLALDPLAEGERGVIVNTASIAAQDGQIGQAGYTASKAGVVGLTLVVARDLASENIRCNTIMPGIMETPMMAGAPPKVKDALSAGVPFPRRFGKPEEYAQLALAIVANAYLNGEAIRLDGALRMPPR